MHAIIVSCAFQTWMRQGAILVCLWSFLCIYRRIPHLKKPRRNVSPPCNSTECRSDSKLPLEERRLRTKRCGHVFAYIRKRSPDPIHLHGYVFLLASTMPALLLFFSVLSVFACNRTLDKGEGRAFKVVLGLCDVQKLIEVEDDVQAFWVERASALRLSVKPHLEFCEMLVQEAKDFLEEAKSPLNPWFMERGSIENVITRVIPEDSPLFPNARAYFYAQACDFVCDQAPYSPRTIHMYRVNTMIDKVHFFVEKYKKISHEFNKKVFWQVLPDGRFSLFDSLVMRSQGGYLCGIVKDPKKRFGSEFHLGHFVDWHGFLEHDCFVHALRQYLFAQALEEFGVSEQDYFDACCNKKTLCKGNIITLAQQSQGWFYRFREIESNQGSDFTDQAADDLLSWTTSSLADSGFCAVTPYFLDTPEGHNWREKPLKKAAGSEEQSEVHAALLRWAEEYCPERPRPLTL